MDRDGFDQPGDGSRGTDVVTPGAPGSAAGPPSAQGDQDAAAVTGRARAAGRELAVLACYLAIGIAVTWPRVTYLGGKLPALRDTGAYVWGFWWVAHQAIHLGNPWSTSYLAAPVGIQLGFHTLMPLPGLMMTPVTLTLGPSVAYNLLVIACPGLLSYAMYRAARLWLPTGPGAFAAGAFFGLSSNLDWRSWYHLNLALGALFLPIVLEAGVRLTRKPTRRRAIILGVALGAALLTDQESAVLAAILAALVLARWLLRQRSAAKTRLAALTCATAALVASPQLLAMAWQTVAGEAGMPAGSLTYSSLGSGADLVQLFAPSPRLAGYGLGGLASLYYHGRPAYVVQGYGLMLSLAALAGLIIAWRRRGTRLLGLLWLGCSVLALGPALAVFNQPYRPLGIWLNGQRVSALMPFTWLIQIPGLANFREADRFAELGLLAAALLAGVTVNWLAARAKPALVVVLALAALEVGWPGNTANGHNPIGVMATTLPALDAPIAADHSRSVVVDVPFGLRGGVALSGLPFPPESMVLATADGHPLGDGYASRVPAATTSGILGQPFYAGLMRAQTGQPNTATEVRYALLNARRMHIGWVLVWVHSPAITSYLHDTGFGFAYQADGVMVYRPVHA